MARKTKRPRSEMDNEDMFQKEDPKGDNFECSNQRVLSQGSSSSYSGSMCGNDDNEDEAQSILNRDFPLTDLCVEIESPKKKKVSDHWIQYTKATRWITKWLEIKYKEMMSRAKVYDKEVNFEETSSVPFHNQTRRKEHFKRKSRKRVEDTTNIADYRAKHHIFSYADKRKSGASNAQGVDFGYDPSQKAMYKEDEDEIESLIAAFESKDILETVLRKVFKAQEKAKSMKKHVDQFISESQSEHAEEPLMSTSPEQSRSESTPHDHTEEDQSVNQTCPPNGQTINLSPLIGEGCTMENMDDEEYVLVDGTEEFETLFRVFKKVLNRYVPSEETDEDDEDEDEDEDEDADEDEDD